MTSCWCLTDGSAGTVTQVRALAWALGLMPEMKKIVIRKPFVWLPNSCYTGLRQALIMPLAFNKRRSDPMEALYPDIIISCGRRAALAAMGLRVALHAVGTRFIHIQDPRVDPSYFDMVVAMEHDDVSGSNVLKTRFALHAINSVSLATAKAHFAERFAHYRRSYTAVLLGGSTNKYTLTPARMQQVIASLRRLGAIHGSLLITPSRRTGAANIAMLRQVFTGNSRVYIYDHTEENPYLGLLALADHIVVTDDSVNMMSEAVATGKPLYILPLPDHRGSKPALFAERLIRDGIARPLSDTLETWRYDIPQDMEKLAGEIRVRLQLP